MDENITISLEGSHLSIVGQNLDQIPNYLGEKYGKQVQQLDLSDNNIKYIENLDKFTNLKSLVIDNNELVSNQKFPRIETLDTLWVNNNKIESLEVFLESIKESFPNLTYISMMKNPCCPNYFIGKDSETYKKYRTRVLATLPKLKFLDASPVTDQERELGKILAQNMVRMNTVSQPKSEDVRIEQTEPEEPEEHEQKEIESQTTFGVTKYVYFGRHSEGNRFIADNQL